MSDNLPAPAPQDSGEFLLYQTEDGQTRIEVRMAEDTIWLSQRAMANLFQATKQNVSLHLQNIYEEGELRPAATVKQYLTVQTEGARRVSRVVDHYSLDAILAVGSDHVSVARQYGPEDNPLFVGMREHAKRVCAGAFTTKREDSELPNRFA